MSHMTPMPGDKAPPLALKVLGGEPLDLAEDRPAAFSVVFFYRGVHCPVCRRQLEELLGLKADFEALGIAVHAVSMDSRERAERQLGDWAIEGLPIAFEMNEATARDWGLFISSGVKDGEPERFSEPGIAVVDPEGTLYALYLQNAAFARPRLTDILAGLKMAIERKFPIRGQVAASASSSG